MNTVSSYNSHWITNRQIEAARIAMTRYMKRGGKVWIKIFPHKSYTAKAIGVRMGSGKGAPEGWVAPVKRGKVMFEIAGVPEEVLVKRCVLHLTNLPVKTKFVKREEMGGERMKVKEIKELTTAEMLENRKTIKRRIVQSSFPISNRSIRKHCTY